MKNLIDVEPVVKLLVGMIFVFSALIIYCEHRFPSDGQVFQVFSNALSGFTGALLMYFKAKVEPKSSEPIVAQQETPK